jgi:Tfp pilus assembly protein PilO
MKFIMPIILIIISVAGFFMFTNPFYDGVKELRLQAASYDEALANSKALENERDKLTQKYNAIDRDDLVKIQKLLPENIDNIRLILEIEQIALPYGMSLKDIKYSADDTTKKSATEGSEEGAPVAARSADQSSGKAYGIWDLEFSTVGSYSNFLNFTRDLEENLRIVDIASIQFSSADTSQASGGSGGTKPASSSPTAESYKYSFKIKTYWLKD